MYGLLSSGKEYKKRNDIKHLRENNAYSQKEFRGVN